jgi:Protein of unknown function (DUF3073)
MGRGRAKAKQTKVARELKYRSFDTDFEALQRELHGDDDSSRRPDSDVTDGDGDPSGDEYAEDGYADDVR